MTNFEVAIINAAKSVIGANTVCCCLFHLAQAVYRRVQSEGLQQQYADPEDSSIRDVARLLVALAYLPSKDIEKGLEALEDAMPDELKTIYDYFEERTFEIELEEDVEDLVISTLDIVYNYGVTMIP